MSIEAKCPQCGSVHLVNDRLAGRRIRCPKCSAAVSIPAAAVTEVVNGEVVTGEQTPAPEGDMSGAADFAKHSHENASSLTGSAVPTLASSRVTAVRRPESPTVPQATAPAVEDEEDDPMPAKLQASDGELDMTPMVDVTFLLLIFFMITAAFSLQKSLESPRQQSDQASSQQKEQEEEELDLVTVQINEYGSYLVMAPEWERETPGKQNLIVALSEAIGNGETAMKLDIQVHESAKLQALVDCMDAGTICNYGDVQVTQVDGFD
jgi:biopolymer transport protein ExbD/ribosomal protein S27E